MNNFTAIILFLASLALFFGYINPTYGKASESGALSKKSIVELRAERARYAEAIGKTREIELARTGLLDKYNALPEASREKIEKLLPDHADAVRLIIGINTMAAARGMTLKNITLSEEGSGKAAPSEAQLGPSEERVVPVEFKFTLSGNYGDFRAFLSDLEQNLRIVDVTTLAFAAKGDGKGDGAREYAVTVAAYRLR